MEKLLGENAPDPRPLLYAPGRIGLIWSHKSACTTAVLWFLANAELMESALSFDPWPHKYRIQVLRVSKTYKRWLREIDPHTARWVRVIRNPYKRAVSAYRHALRHRYENAQIELVVGLPVTDRGFSFDEFLEYLLKIDISNCNQHHRQQWHPLEERVKCMHVVNADREVLLDALYAFSDPGAEARARLSAELTRIAANHHARIVPVDGDCSKMVFQQRATGGPWPEYSAFLNADMRAKIARIYAKDFEAYAAHL